MTRLLVLAAFLAGIALTLWWLDALFGGRGLRIELRPGHRRALDELG